MTCIKTGARIFFENYGYGVVGDVFVVGDCYTFRWNNRSVDYNFKSDNATHIVRQIEDSSSWFHREDLGITVVPCYLVIAKT